MFGYLFVLAVLTFWHFICRQSNDKGYKRFLLGAAIIMTLFYGLRGISVGSDTISYVTMFINDGAQPIDNLWVYMWEQKSPAYVLCEWIFYRFLPYPQLWLIATSAFFFFVFSNFIKKNSPDPYFSYFLFFTIFGTFQMTGVRQSCAMAVLMLAYEQLKKKKLLKYLLLAVLAYLFHKSAIVFLPFYFVAKRKITSFDIPVMAVILAFIYSNRSFLFDFIKSFTSYDYFEQLNHGEPVNFSIMIYGATVLGIILCCFLQYGKRKEFLLKGNFPKKILQNSNINKQLRQLIKKDMTVTLYSQYANAMLLASLFMPLVAINGSVRRIVMYFALFMILLIPKAIKELFPFELQLLGKLGLGVILTYLLVRGTMNSSYSYYLCFF